MKGAHNFMESILNDLYHSRSDYFTRNYEMVPGFIDAMKQAEKLKEELKETLPESKHTLLNEYEEAMTTLFCHGSNDAATIAECFTGIFPLTICFILKPIGITEHFK